MTLLETMHIDGLDYTFAQLRHMLGRLGIREGVFGTVDFAVTQRAAGANMSVDVAAGDAWVKGDTSLRQGFYFQTNDATVNVAVGAAHATLPRIDQVVLQMNDSNVVGGTNTPALAVLAGTATAGATLVNRTGAAALGNDRLLLADVLVPAASTTVTTANIKSRRLLAASFLASPEPNLDTVRGLIDGAISGTGGNAEGTGYSVNKISAGYWAVTFDTAFSDIPAVQVTPVGVGGVVALNTVPTAAGFEVITGAGASTSAKWCFTAVGPR